jgi:hypothetical protein
VNDYIFLMYDTKNSSAGTDSDWEQYIKTLVNTGHFAGGSAIGGGLSISRSGEASSITAELSGYIRVTASSIEEAQNLLAGNPTYEGGGKIEIRELPRTG